MEIRVNMKIFTYFFCYASIYIIGILSLIAQPIIYNQQTMKPMSGVCLRNQDGKSCYTGRDGKITHCVFAANDTIIISHSNYEILRYVWKELNNELKIYLISQHYDLGEVKIDGYGFQEARKELPAKIDLIKSEWLDFHQPQTTADALEKSGHVFIQKSQMGGGSPIIRGFEANRILIVVDGIRMNNAIFRSGHLQNVIRSDVQSVERIEIINGPSSVCFGSDAMGGVIHVRTISPPDPIDSLSIHNGKGVVRWGGANQEKSIHAQYGFAKKKWSLFSSFSFSHYDDLRQGNWIKSKGDEYWRRNFYVERVDGIDSIIKNTDPYIQRQSGYFQYNILQKISYKSDNGIRHKINMQFSSTGNVNRYDRLTEVNDDSLPRFAQWYYGPETWLLAAYNVQLSKSNWYDEAEISFSYQYFDESRNSRRFQNIQLLNQNEQVHMGRIASDFQKNISKHRLQYGIELTYQHVLSKALYRHVNSGEKELAPTRYPGGGSHYYTAGMYVTEHWRLSDNMHLHTGGRLVFTGMNAMFSDTTFFPFPFKQANQYHFSGSGSLGVVFRKKSLDYFSLQFSSGFRAPNIDDLGKVFESRPGNVIVPNANLRPEYTMNIEMGLGCKISRYALLQFSAYSTYANGLMQVMPYQLNGDDSIMYDGEKSSVWAVQNSSQAFLAGASASFVWYPHTYWYFSCSVNYTWGIVSDSSGYVPLDHIPPLFGRAAVGIRYPNITIEMYVIFQGSKPKELYHPSGEDNIHYATPSGMPGWATLNINGSFRVNPSLDLQLGIDNILNQQYRTFASGISGAGISCTITLYSRF